MKNLFYLILILPLFRPNACVKENSLCHKRIEFQNRGQEAFFVVPSVGHWSKVNDDILMPGDKWILYTTNKDCWEHVFKDQYEFSSDILTFSVYNTDQVLIEKVEVSLPDLRRNNFIIGYVPNHE